MANKRRIQEWLIKNKMWDYGERMERGGIKQKGKCVCVWGGGIIVSKYYLNLTWADLQTKLVILYLQNCARKVRNYFRKILRTENCFWRLCDKSWRGKRGEGRSNLENGNVKLFVVDYLIFFCTCVFFTFCCSPFISLRAKSMW